MRVAICDESSVCCEIERLIRLYFMGTNPEWVEISWYEDVKTLAFDVTRGSHFDVVFCDILMPYELLPSIERNFILVVVGTRCLDVEKLLQAQVHFFMKKPIDPKRFFQIFRKMYHLAGKHQVYMELTHQREQIKIRVEDILYIESCGRKIDVVLAAGAHVESYARLGEVEKRLMEKNMAFLRLHHSYLVNFRKIYSCIGHQVRLKDGTMLPISRDRYHDFRIRYQQLMDNEDYIRRMLQKRSVEEIMEESPPFDKV